MHASTRRGHILASKIYSQVRVVHASARTAQTMVGLVAERSKEADERSGGMHVPG
jgi:hypothetical protein